MVYIFSILYNIVYIYHLYMFFFHPYICIYIYIYIYVYVYMLETRARARRTHFVTSRVSRAQISKWSLEEERQRRCMTTRLAASKHDCHYILFCFCSCVGFILNHLLCV